jgi:hypothetical protein
MPNYNLLDQQAFATFKGTGTNKNGLSNGNIRYEKRSTEYVESLYISNTDGLIGVMDGTITNTEDGNILANEFNGEPADYVIYLDKSARPIRYLVHSLWDSLATNSALEPHPLFLNIDKEVWLRQMGFSETLLQEIDPVLVDIRKIGQDALIEQIARIRALFVGQQIDDESLQSVWDLETFLDGKKIAIVDEVKSSGNTLLIASQIIKSAFPKSRLCGVYWAVPPRVSWDYLMDGVPQSGFCASYVPVWYDANTSAGRGVDDIDPLYSAKSNSYVQRMGQFILSTPYHKPGTTERIYDFRSKQIREDLNLLTHRFKSGEVLFRPSPYRDYADFTSRASGLNGGISLVEFRKRINRLD